VDDVRLGQTALVSSFGADSIVLLHMLSKIDRSVPVIFVDTLMLFRETLQYQKDVAAGLQLTDVRIVSPSTSVLISKDVDCLLHQSKPDVCCSIRKTEPLNKALTGFDSWITGRKRSQGGVRSEMPLFERDNRKLKVNPLANWSFEQVRTYISENKLPNHPLLAKRYTSIGCHPCTTPVAAGESVRAGRWRGTDKTECGIHDRL
jgi:phosphoadenosine phosphosulfate reductase